jgi:hypothetical protein
MARTVDQRSLNAIGKLLYPYMIVKGYSYGQLAEKLQLNKDQGQQVIWRLLRLDLAKHRRFPQIHVEDLVWALDVTETDQKELRALTAGLEFARGTGRPPSFRPGSMRSNEGESSLNRSLATTSGYSELLAAVRAEEPHLIYLLHVGQAAYVLDAARRRSVEIRDDPNFPPSSKTEWLLRLGKLIEQAQEVAGEWHGERVMRSFRSIRQLFDDISHVNDSADLGSKHYYDEVILLARKGELWRELYRDTTGKSTRYLAASNRSFEDALFRLDTLGVGHRYLHTSTPQEALFFRDAILRLVVRCQQLHILAVSGDGRWEEHIQPLEEVRDALSSSFASLHHTIIDYFKSVGYKRLAWASRPLYESQWQDSARQALQRYYFDMAHRYMERFLSSHDSLAAWRAANFFAFELPGIGSLPNTQRSLASDGQAKLLLSISMYEGEVWRDPESTRRIIVSRLEPEIHKIYISAQVKVRNTQQLADTIMLHR